MTSAPAPDRMQAPWTRAPWLPLILLAAALAARAQTFGNPVIEFDEQYYRLIGERMLHGALPFVDIWDRKPVGLFLLYALAAAVGGPGPLPYQVMASLFVAGTAWLVFAMARRLCAGLFGPLVAALLYIFWLNLLQGEGGQASVLTALPVCAAALLLLRHVAGEAPAAALGRDGALAMLLVGLAAQIKYTVLLEGAFFGLALVWLGRRADIGAGRLMLLGGAWAGLAALPTLLAWAAYAAMGHGAAWLFANVTSIFLRAPMPLGDMLGELAGGLATIALLVLAAWLGWRRAEAGGAEAGRRFVALWALVAFAAMLPLRSFSPHYWIPLVPPLALLAVPALERMRRFAVGLALLAAVAGQGLVGFFIWSKGDARTVARMAAAIGPAPRCIFVFDGFPALYAETGACLPTAYLFPSLLNGVMEARAIGVDPVAEVERILAARPDAIVIDEPRWSLRNPRTTAIVDRALAAHYRLVLREETGKGRFRLVYRREAEDDGR